MAATGLGVDGYLRYQKESTYGTDIISSMTLLPIKDSTNISAVVENIENSNVISSRVKQDPDSGRILIGGNIDMDIAPTLIGDILEIFLGGATTSGPTDTAVYTHYWLTPISGERIAESMTVQSALGGDLADQFSGMKIVAMTLSGEVGGNLMCKFEVVGQGYTEDVARISSFSYPSTAPFSFAHAALSEATIGTMSVNSFSLTIDLGYDRERFKNGSAETENPVFQTIPSCTFSCNLDADQTYIDNARAHTEMDLTLTLTHATTIAGAGSTKYTLVAEMPGARLNPDTNIPNGSERLTMDLEFDCGYGATTTNSGSDVVMFELRLLDESTTHT